jgi:hypothetical protein
MGVRFGMTDLQVWYDNGPPICCQGINCGAKIPEGTMAFVDLINNERTLCLICGQALRYHRKKAHERGEDYTKILTLKHVK